MYCTMFVRLNGKRLVSSHVLLWAVRFWKTKFQALQVKPLIDTFLIVAFHHVPVPILFFLQYLWNL